MFNRDSCHHKFPNNKLSAEISQFLKNQYLTVSPVSFHSRNSCRTPCLSTKWINYCRNIFHIFFMASPQWTSWRCIRKMPLRIQTRIASTWTRNWCHRVSVVRKISCAIKDLKQCIAVIWLISYNYKIHDRPPIRCSRMNQTIHLIPIIDNYKMHKTIQQNHQQVYQMNINSCWRMHALRRSIQKIPIHRIRKTRRQKNNR